MSEKNAGIITFHHNHNYGTMLQAIALQKAIYKCGYTSELINYEKKPTDRIQLFKIRLSRLGAYVLHFKKYYTLFINKSNAVARERLFEEFYRKYALIGKTRYESIEDLNNNPPQYELYIVGSDQTWSPSISEQKEKEVFFLSFVPEGSVKGSYAPSIGLSRIKEHEKELFKKYLDDFKYLSCREKTGSQILSEVLGKDVVNVLDPTLLLEEDEWLQMADGKIIEEPYILEYFLGNRIEHRGFVKKLSRQTGLKIVSLPFDSIDMADTSLERLYVGPAQFLRLIHDAEYVCTDSFHGSVFSVIFKTKFFSFCKHSDYSAQSENSRLYDFLDSIHLNDRIVMDYRSSPSLSINFDESARYLKKLREASWDYLVYMLDQELG